MVVLTGTLTAARVLAGFGNVTVWLVFTAFLFSRAVTQTGFGTRVGYGFIERFGRTPLRLGYSLAAADLVLAPFIPSDTARGGGVVFPITRSVAGAFGSEPGPTAKKIGAFLVLVSFHTTYTASAMFLTGMAANPLIAEFAYKIGHVELTWGRWLAGSIVPGFLTLAIVPWLLFRLVRPEIQHTEEARDMARRELARRGPMQREEKWLVAIMLGVMAGWVTSPWHGVSNTFVALTGLCALLLARVISWDDLLAEHRAWDALIWFAPLVMMSDAMNENGAIKVLSGGLFGVMHGWAWPLALGALVTAYCYVHYGFASMTGHVTALYPAFLAATLAARRSADDGGAGARVFFQFERGDDALRYGVGAGVFRGGLCAAGGVVAAGVRDFAGESGDLAGDRSGVVEAGGDLVGGYENWKTFRLFPGFFGGGDGGLGGAGGGTEVLGGALCATGGDGM